jgi:hypothetical protein
MAKMGNYCKAYPITRFQEYPDWPASLSTEPAPAAGDGSAANEDPLAIHPDYLFLQENYTVTKGVFLDEALVFDQVTPAWKEFCVNVLKFELPTYDELPVPAEKGVVIGA